MSDDSSALAEQDLLWCEFLSWCRVMARAVNIDSVIAYREWREKEARGE